MSDTSLGDSTFIDDREIPPDNGPRFERPPWDVENLYDYEPGGHHPVHLDDILHQRYKVLHKLGSGGYANVWLCRDASITDFRYVAVKIIAAEGSTAKCPGLRVEKLMGLSEPTGHFCLPLDRFDITGPNGVHYAFVYPVLGPRVSKMPNLVDSTEDLGGPLRQLCLQATRAMAILHENGICHGDFRPANILARLTGLDGLSEESLIETLGKPETGKILTKSGDAHDLPSAPQYIVYPINWDFVPPSLITNEACITDFGECFEISSPTADLGMPKVYCSPEYTLEGTVGISCDIWALGCTLYEIRTGKKLFPIFDDDPDEFLYALALKLGKFPEPWWSETWAARKEIFQDETDAEGRVLGFDNRGTVKTKEEERVTNINPLEPRSIRETVAEGLYYEHKGGFSRGISQEETALFSDLLEKLMRFSPSDRLSPREALEHDWFRFEEASSS